MSHVNFRLLNISDAEKLSFLLLNSSEEYTRFFYPFDFQVSSLKKTLKSPIKDKFFGIEIINCTELYLKQLIGFYMLRGMDEGYREPMYGIFVDQKWKGKGIAQLSLYHAECFCKINLYQRLLLKVDLNNYRAKQLYEFMGFQFLRNDTKMNSVVLYKDFYKGG